MNHSDVFSTPEETIKQLSLELREVRDLLREAVSKLSRIETRARRVFPSAFPPTTKQGRGPGQSPAEGTSTISPEQALQIYDEVVVLARTGKPEEVERRLASIATPDLVLLAKELGLPGGKNKPSPKQLIAKILGRVKESIMLSKHTYREKPDSEGSSSLEPPSATR